MGAERESLNQCFNRIGLKITWDILGGREHVIHFPSPQDEVLGTQVTKLEHYMGARRESLNKLKLKPDWVNHLY